MVKYGGIELILDNFRLILSDFSVDIQDIVRSAILDNVNIGEYIDSCKDSPYKLDQIRLAIKEGMPSIYFNALDGDFLYKVRVMRRKNINTTWVEGQLRKGYLSNKHLSYVLKWVEDGINITNLNISIIPDTLLEVFDYGLYSGMDMRPYNTGKSYTSRYIRLCLQIANNGKDVSFLLNGEWSLAVLTLLSSFSRINIQAWDLLINNIDLHTSDARVRGLIPLASNLVDIGLIQKKSKGVYVFSDECLSLVYSAYKDNLDYKRLIVESDNYDCMKIKLGEMYLKKGRKVSGRTGKHSIVHGEKPA